MKKMTMLLCVAAVAGCTAPNGEDQGVWVDASPALKEHGVYSYRVETAGDPAAQAVALRGPAAESIGRVELSQGVVSLALKATTWRQEIVAATGEMKLVFDGQAATLTWDGGAWQGDAAARLLWAQSQPFVDLVRLVGGEATLAPSAPPSSAEAKPSHDAGSGPKPDAGAPSLQCSSAVVTGSGWAWYWEKTPATMACRRATEAVTASCELSSGYACCNLPKDCISCVDWGTGFACSTAGYLQYAGF